MKPARILIATLLLGGATACSLLTGLLHMQPVEVSAYFPCEEFVDAASIDSVSVSFSSAMNRARTEEAFRLSEGGVPLPGSFAWEGEGRTVRFSPSPPLRAGATYWMAVSTAAEDLYGNSLASELAFRFSTGTDGDRPRVTAHSPDDGATVSDLRTPVHICFSEPPEPASVLAGLSVVPAVRGSLSWSAGGSEITFLPLEDYASGQVYAVRLSGDICDPSGNRLPEDVEFRFRTEDQPEPQVLSVICSGSGRPVPPDDAGGTIDLSLGIEKDERFAVTLSLPLLPTAREDAIALQPAVQTAVSWNPAGDSCQVGFREHLQWNRLYTLRILDQCYSFVVNGADSVPPEVMAICYCPDINASPAQFVVLAFAGNYSFLSAPAPVFDFHLRHALGAAIDLGSFMKALSIEAGGGCLHLECHELAVSPLPVDPDPLPGAGESVVRLLCSIDDDPAVSGPLTFRLDTQLGDSLGNHLPADHVLVVNNNMD
jgi:hypothetical protein